MLNPLAQVTQLAGPLVELSLVCLTGPLGFHLLASQLVPLEAGSHYSPQEGTEVWGGEVADSLGENLVWSQPAFHLVQSFSPPPPLQTGRPISKGLMGCAHVGNVKRERGPGCGRPVCVCGSDSCARALRGWGEEGSEPGGKPLWGFFGLLRPFVLSEHIRLPCPSQKAHSPPPWGRRKSRKRAKLLTYLQSPPDRQVTGERGSA